MHGFTPSTYESASTAAFKHGRTETIRSATPEAAAFASAFCDPLQTTSTKVALMRTAVDNHTRITRDALMGKGVDRHLYALQALAAGEGLAPTLFRCQAYAKMSRIVLSTSTLASDALENGGFGPVNEDCFALGYGIRPYGCRTLVMTYGRDSRGFADCLERAMLDMREVAAA